MFVRRRITRRSRNRVSNRSGMTLFEVTLAITIFLMAMTAISELISVGSRAAIDGKLQTEAAIHCENILTRVLLQDGIEMVDGLSGEVIDGSDKWLYSLKVEDASVDKLKDLFVTVSHYPTPGGKPNASFTIRRLVRDPQIFIDAAEADADAAAENDDSSP
ncbi:MAG: hypothetical protein IID45_04385 [Planctomycetes bacterium]|nr:hypothetical protein [Planctomycetota bacterium]